MGGFLSLWGRGYTWALRAWTRLGVSQVGEGLRGRDSPLRRALPGRGGDGGNSLPGLRLL